MKKISIVLILTFYQISLLLAQTTITQTIKGVVVDVTSKTPIIGATFVIEGSNPIIGTVTDMDGTFRLTDIPVGRYNFKISSVGYEPQIVKDIIVGSSKEVVLNIEMSELVQVVGEVVVKAITKEKPINPMATLSAKTFTIEETRRYAGGLDDPARMVSAFAGVTEANMRDNAIIIRGNSPKGVLYRLEGVRIPNPNHFSGGTVVGGGGVSMLSSQLLANSDFYTGAFPAEYGNALAGVFDMKLREGNREKFEHTLQFGVLGMDIASEGPIGKKSGASYLFNYRYSTLALISIMGIIPESEIPKYQDLSFKINMPTKKAGNFSLWGIGGLDNLDHYHESDSSKWETSYDRTENRWTLNTGVVGLTHKLITGPKTFINTTLALTGVQSNIEAAMFDNNFVQRPALEIKDDNETASFSTFLSHKLSLKFSIKTGLNLYKLFYNLSISSIINEDYETYNNYVNESGNSTYLEHFIQSKYSISPQLTANIGLNTHYFLLNNKLDFDPRIGLKWDFADRMSLSAAYGKHTQTEELRIYMIKQNHNGSPSLPNKNLELSKAHHFVLGFDWLLTENIKLKVEPYYQYLYDIPGIPDSSYSMINFKQDWALSDSLGNNSSGANLGVDITLERFFRNNYYFLLTGSIFDSKYKADDGLTRSTRYDKGFAINFLFGKEFTIRKTKLLGLNSRVTYTGGEKTSPINEELSKQQMRVVYNESKAFSEQLPSACFVDLTITFRNNKRKHAGIWALQMKNILGSKMYDSY